MKTFKSFVLFVLLSLIGFTGTSCRTLDSGKALTAAGAAGAGALAWKLTEGKSSGERLAWTAASTVGAYVLGEHVRSKISESEKERFKEGYEAGLADSAKIQYQIIQNRQQENLPVQRRRYVIYEFPGVTERDGVNFVPHTVKLRVLEE